ncbi:MAG: AsmA family protein [Clostridia bacterium]
MKALKYVLFALAGLAVLAVGALAIFAATFDPNRYKGQIQSAVKEKTGRTLKLEGDLKVAFFPSLGADVGKASLSERGAETEFLSLDSAHASVAVLPLLHGEVIVDKVSVSGLKAHVVKGKDGKYNFDDLLHPQGKSDKEEKGARKGGEAPKQEGNAKFDLAGVSIDRSSVSYKDLASGQELEIGDLKVSTGRLGEKAAGKLDVAATVRGKNPAIDLKVNLAGDYDVDISAGVYKLAKVGGSANGSIDKQALDAKLSAPRIDITKDKASGEAITADFQLKGPQRTTQANLKIAGIQGSAKALSIPSLTAELAMSGPDMPRAFKVPLTGSVQADLEKQTASADLTSKFDESNIHAKLGLAKFSPPSYLFDVNVDKLNLDQYFPPEKKGTGAQAPAGQPSGQPQAKKEEDSPVDLSGIKDLNANGKLAVGALQAKGVKLSNVKADIKAANGRLDVAPHSANLYEGTLSGALALQAAGNHVSLKENLAGVAIGPLLRDAAHQDRLEGKGNVSLDVAGAGPTVNAIKKSLDGSAKVNLKDGAIKGVDIGAILQKVKSIGKKSEEGQANGREQTSFTELNASFVIKNGVAHNQDLDVKAPLLRIGGAGDIDIGNSSLNYTVKAAVVATTAGQGGKGLEQLSGLTVPVKLSGPFDNMKYQVDYGAAAGELAKSKVGEKVKEKIGGEKGQVQEKVQEKLKGLLGR